MGYLSPRAFDTCFRCLVSSSYRFDTLVVNFSYASYNTGANAGTALDQHGASHGHTFATDDSEKTTCEAGVSVFKCCAIVSKLGSWSPSRLSYASLSIVQLSLHPAFPPRRRTLNMCACQATIVVIFCMHGRSVCWYGSERWSCKAHALQEQAR